MLPEAWAKYDLFLNDPRISFVDEPAQIETHWRSFTQNRSFSPQVWNDAYLAAFALVGGFELVTFDKGFAQYQNVTSVMLPWGTAFIPLRYRSRRLHGKACR